MYANRGEQHKRKMIAFSANIFFVLFIFRCMYVLLIADYSVFVHGVGLALEPIDGFKLCTLYK